MKLNEAINSPISIELGGVKMEFKRASLSALAKLQEKQEEVAGKVSADITSTAYALWLCYVGEPMSFDEFTDSIPVEAIHDDSMKDALERLGFSKPQREKQAKRLTGAQ